MSPRANVRSLDAVRHFRPAVIRFEDDVAAALVGQFSGQLIEPVGITGHQDDVVAVGGVATSETLADSGSRPRDQGDAARHGASVLSARTALTQRW